ncbi:hypothetical protein F4824DRAFT_458774 [Ustulina deusta]|nr:hypothetical protein F4824DRAFT_458774 [Ustulina deusta]
MGPRGLMARALDFGAPSADSLEIVGSSPAEVENFIVPPPNWCSGQHLTLSS